MSDEPLADIRGMRIAHLIESDGPGGAERMLAQMAVGLQNAGCENVVFLPVDGEGWLESQLGHSGVAIERMRFRAGLSRRFARWLEGAFRRYEVRLAHSHEFTMAFYGAWAARRAGIGHVITMHGGRYYAGRFRRRIAMRAAVAASSLTVAVSRTLATGLAKDLWLPQSRITFIPNGVEAAQSTVPSLRNELALGQEDRLVVSVGNLYPVKGHRYLIEALGLLPARPYSVHLAIAGRGEVEDKLRAQAERQGLTGRVHLLGLRSDIPDLLASADVFVLPSISEGLPLALLEAMLAGCPIVATNVGEVSTVLGNGHEGIVVQPADSRTLADKIDLLLRDPIQAREMGQRALRHATQEYTLSRMMTRYAAAYRHIVMPGGPFNSNR